MFKPSAESRFKNVVLHLWSSRPRERKRTQGGRRQRERRGNLKEEKEEDRKNKVAMRKEKQLFG